MSQQIERFVPYGILGWIWLSRGWFDVASYTEITTAISENIVLAAVAVFLLIRHEFKQLHVGLEASVKREGEP